MMDDKMFTIHVRIGGFQIPMTIPRSDEELYRRAQKLVDQHLEMYQKRYSQRSYEEILTLTAFHLATIIVKQQLSGDTGPVEDKLKELEAEIDTVLRKE